MADRYEIGAHFEAFVESQLASGRYLDAGEVLRDGLRLLEDREKRLSSFDVEIDRGIADLEAGRIHDADEMFDALEARYGAMIAAKSVA
jgi:antitoxin ParD1/3/4